MNYRSERLQELNPEIDQEDWQRLAAARPHSDPSDLAERPVGARSEEPWQPWRPISGCLGFPWGIDVRWIEMDHLGLQVGLLELMILIVRIPSFIRCAEKDD